MTGQPYNLWVGGQEKLGHAEQFVTISSFSSPFEGSQYPARGAAGRLSVLELMLMLMLILTLMLMLDSHTPTGSRSKTPRQVRSLPSKFSALSLNFDARPQLFPTRVRLTGVRMRAAVTQRPWKTLKKRFVWRTRPSRPERGQERPVMFAPMFSTRRLSCSLQSCPR